MAAVKIATYFFRAHEIADLEEEYECNVYILPDQMWEHVIKQKLSPPSCPTALLNEITAAVRALNVEVWYWVMDHLEISGSESKTLSVLPLAWKSDGTINRIRTADILIQSQVLDLETRFAFACNYWCWHDIWEFSKTIPVEEFQIILMKYRNRYLTETDVPMISLWFKFIIDTTLRHSCQLWCLASKWNQITLFNRVFNHLPIEKRIALGTLAVQTSHIPLVRYFLERMDKQRQFQMLEQYPYQVLRVLLYWPLQSFFTVAAATVRETLSNRSFLHLIHIIICQKILPGWRDFNYVDLLRTFWRESSIGCKEYVRGDAIFEILTVVLEGRGFRTHLRSGIPRRYLTHGENLIVNTIRCINLTIPKAN
ncbi:uncharacterized protein TNCV_609801 [Trichonephila clavipes]|nr:uncharacterized protein TNCV_609801 [Trichonephila clavipes]